MSDAEDIRRYTDALPLPNAESQRIGELATAYLRRMYAAEDAGHVRWDNRLKDWVMTPRHPAWGLDDE